MGSWHRHYDLTCVDCGIVVFPIAACIMWAGPSGCTISQSIQCEDCRAAESIRNAGEPPGYHQLEVGVYPAEQSGSSYAQPMVERSVRDVLQIDVPHQAQGLVQDKKDEDGTKNHTGPKPARVEQVRPYVPEEERLPTKGERV